MKFIEIIQKTIQIISTPAKMWELLLKEKNDHSKNFFFFYSLLALNIAATFFGTLLNEADYPFIKSLLKALIWGVAIYVGYWGIYFVLVEFILKRFEAFLTKQEAHLLLIYSFVLSLAISILTALFPDLFFIKIAYIYTLFIVWEGTGKIIPSFDENKRSNFVLLFSCSIILIPTIIYQILILAVPAAQ